MERWEYDRLAGRLASMPTTEWQDLELLRSVQVADWKRLLLVRFRLQRKRALRLALERMEQSWVAHEPNLTAACEGPPGSLSPQQPQHNCARTARMPQCPARSGSSVHKLLRSLQNFAGALLLSVRARLNLIVPSLLFVFLLFATVSPVTGVVVCLAIAATVCLQQAEASGIIQLGLGLWS
jgi:hypothetical protein